MKRILVCFGGVSAEHEVSIITGLQVIEHIDRSIYTVDALYVTQKGEFLLLAGISDRADFEKIKRERVVFGTDEKGGFLETKGIFSKKIYPDCAFFAFHGGNGESGTLQGLFDSLSIPYTSPDVESSAVSMNKAITKEIVSAYGVRVIPGLTIKSLEALKVTIPLKLPLIVKPSHLGSSIGVSIAKTKAGLTKALSAASLVDTEIVVEELMENYTEYNVAVRTVNRKVEVSEVERPIKKDEILSFADKYERGGGKKTGGMASLSRELPAKIPTKLKKEIQETAKSVYNAVRAKGMIRCDFMLVKQILYLIEVNPIPGSMAFYLWEASGINFETQITDLIETAIEDFEFSKSKRMSYSTNIVKKFISSTNQ